MEPVKPKAVLKSRSTVVIEGEDLAGNKVIQEIELTHDDPAAPVSMLIGKAFSNVVQMGGLMHDGEDQASMVYYPWAHLRSGVRFSVKRVQLAQSGLVV